MRAFSAYSSVAYIQIVMKSITLAKDIFILDVEQGDEVIIPGMILQSDLPQCFHFYNPAMKLIQEECTKDRKFQFIDKNKLYFNDQDK